ncbi:MAG TPA: hypothetical protein VJ623_14625 [Holophagaceae bacterium]|nr:hypothetical protein [Holophagaceae bacterium]
MWDRQTERRQSLTPFQGPDRRRPAGPGIELHGPQVWASLKDHKVPSRNHHASPRMAHWQTLENPDLWE